MWRSLILAALMPVSALASCPTRADLAEGVVLVQNTPAFLRSDFQIGFGGIVEDRVDRIEGPWRRDTRIWTHGLLDSTRVDYDGRVSALDNLPDAGHVLLTGELRDTRRRMPVAFDATYLGPGSRALAECNYETWRVRIQEVFVSRAGPAFEVDYAPELGLVLAVALLDDTGTPVPLYAYQWAGTAADVAR